MKKAWNLIEICSRKKVFHLEQKKWVRNSQFSRIEIQLSHKILLFQHHIELLFVYKFQRIQK